MTLLENIREAFARLAQLTTEELDTLKADIVKCSDEYDALPATPENVAVLNELAEIGEAGMAQAQALADAQAQAEADKEAAKARIAKINAKAEDPEADPNADPAADPAADPSADPAVAPAADPVAIAASGKPSGMIRRLAANTPRATPSPEINAQPGRSHLVASGNMHGVDRGTIFEDRYQLARAMSDTLTRMSKRDKAHGDVVVASAEWDYPEDRRLTDDQTHNAELMDAVTHPMSLVATGGICAPVNVDWSLGTWAVADRPLRDGLPAFQASRGGLIYRTPPDISALSSATGVWTEAVDFNPAGATKPVLAIACPGTETVYVAAVSTRLGFGNMESMFDPETVAANTDLAIAAAARVAELNLLTLIQAMCVADVTTAAYLGASRDIFRILDQVTAAYRQLHRLSATQVLTIILPNWAKDLIRADRVAEIGHDGSSVDPLGIPDAYIEGLFALRQLNPIFTLEGLAVDSGVYPAQNFAAFAASSALPAWPDKLVADIFVEGSIQFLDGGRLDLGVVRDSTLDSTNDYETFTETFETVANRGFSASALQLVIEVVPNGATAGTVTPTAWS